MSFRFFDMRHRCSRIATVFFVILILSFFFAGCSKNNDNSSPDNGDYYMRFTISGVAKEYKGNTLAQFTNPGYEATMVALKETLNASESSMSIALNSETPFTTNSTYTEVLNDNGDIEAFLIYTDELGNIYTSLTPTLAPDTKVSVQFTAIADGYVKGIFSGKLYEDAFSPSAYVVTNGSFYLKRE